MEVPEAQNSSPAVRVDRFTGVQQRLEYVPTSKGLLYTWVARPPAARTCVLICSSIFGDFTSNYHRERSLGRALVSRGHGVIRFHYAGEGNSTGERRDVTFHSLCDDAGAVVEHAMWLGFSQFAILGTRLGALVAAATVASMPMVPLVLWEPLSDPLRAIADALRARRVSQTARGGPTSSLDWQDELKRNGVLDLLGYEIYPPLVESLKQVDLLTSLGPDLREVFVAHFRGRPGAGNQVRNELIHRGFPVQVGAFNLSESWWFHTERTPENGDLIHRTTAWLSNVLSGS